MDNLTEDCQKIGTRLDRIRQLIQENPQLARHLLDEWPEFHKRIQEIVLLLKELRVDVSPNEDESLETL